MAAQRNRLAHHLNMENNCNHNRPHTSLNGLTAIEFENRSNLDQDLNTATYKLVTTVRRSVEVLLSFVSYCIVSYVLVIEQAFCDVFGVGVCTT